MNSIDTVGVLLPRHDFMPHTHGQAGRQATLATVWQSNKDVPIIMSLRGQGKSLHNTPFSVEHVPYAH